MRPVFGFSDGIFSIDIEKRAEFGFHVDPMHVARQCGIGPDLDFRSIGTYPGQRQRGGNIHIGRKSLCRLACRAVEYLERFGNLFDVDVVVDDIGSACEPAGSACG